MDIVHQILEVLLVFGGHLARVGSRILEPAALDRLHTDPQLSKGFFQLKELRDHADASGERSGICHKTRTADGNIVSPARRESTHGRHDGLPAVTRFLHFLVDLLARHDTAAGGINPQNDRLHGLVVAVFLDLAHGIRRLDNHSLDLHQGHAVAGTGAHILIPVGPGAEKRNKEKGEAHTADAEEEEDGEEPLC